MPSSISIRSSVSFNRQTLADWMAWLLTLCCLKTPQLELRGLDDFQASSCAKIGKSLQIQPVCELRRAAACPNPDI